MPRQPRYFIPGIPQHVIARGVDRQPVFFQAEDYRLYLAAVKEAAKGSRCLVHAYVLMTNHVHLLATPGHERSLPLLMQAMGRTYVQRLNTRYGRTGTLWEGRYKASPIQSNEYLLACQRYIELNPVRAGMVTAPGHYPYSSYAHHALGKADPLLTPHALFFSLGASPAVRQRAYRRLFRDTLSNEFLTQLRRNTNACTVIGNDLFRKQIAKMLGREVPTGKRGRPRKRP
jgi:putative transposase